MPGGFPFTIGLVPGRLLNHLGECCNGRQTAFLLSISQTLIIFPIFLPSVCFSAGNGLCAFCGWCLYCSKRILFHKKLFSFFEAIFKWTLCHSLSKMVQLFYVARKNAKCMKNRALFVDRKNNYRKKWYRCYCYNCLELCILKSCLVACCSISSTIWTEIFHVFFACLWLMILSLWVWYVGHWKRETGGNKLLCQC